jgi:GxxExxY protein
LEEFYYINLIKKIIETAIETYNESGPGLSRNNYLQYMAAKLSKKNSTYNFNLNLSQKFINDPIPTNYITNLIIDNKILIEVIIEEKILPIHENKLLNTMKSTHIELGLLLNFKKMILNDGIRILIFQDNKKSNSAFFSKSFKKEKKKT